jgi:hypothetical protein
MLRDGIARRSLAAVAAAAIGAMAAGSALAQPRAVVELFTSEGCSSCPPADKLLGQLAADPALVAISVHIDYWDYIGWKDTLADPRNTARQKAYAQARGDGRVYTPQAVVNGSLHALGSDRSAIEHAIAKSRKLGAMSLPPILLALAGTRLDVKVPDAADPVVASAEAPSVPAAGEAKAAEVWLCGLSRMVTVAIRRGENKGRDITYHNVMRRWTKLGDWNGKAHSWRVPLTALDGAGIDTAAVLVQAGRADKPKAILGAALIPIR